MDQALTKTPECQHSLDLLDQASPAVLDAGEHLDVAFMSRSFCMVGLPLRRQFVKDPATKKSTQVEVTRFLRTDERFSLEISADSFTLPDRNGTKAVPCQVGLPFGARARLLIIWMTTQARLTNSRWLEIGKVEEWLKEAGIIPNPEACLGCKEQLFRLAFARFKMLLIDRGQKQTFFRSNQLVSSAIFGHEDLENYSLGKLGKVRYPTAIELSDEAYKTFTNQNQVIAVSSKQLSEISNNAMSIDIFLFLNFKLPQIAPGKTEVVSWRTLVKQFGSSETATRFRYVFEDSIRHAMRVYSGANVELTEQGLELRYSPPAEVRKSMVAVPKLRLIESPKQPELKPVRVRNRIALSRADQTELDL